MGLGGQGGDRQQGVRGLEGRSLGGRRQGERGLEGRGLGGRRQGGKRGVRGQGGLKGQGKSSPWGRCVAPGGQGGGRRLNARQLPATAGTVCFGSFHHNRLSLPDLAALKQASSLAKSVSDWDKTI